MEKKQEILPCNKGKKKSFYPQVSRKCKHANVCVCMHVPRLRERLGLLHLLRAEADHKGGLRSLIYECVMTLEADMIFLVSTLECDNVARHRLPRRPTGSKSQAE